MKKTSLTIIAILFVSALGFSNSNPKIALKTNNLKKTEKKRTNKKEETICSTSCTITIGDVQYYTSAGNWFTSCETAASRCEAKLAQLLQ